MSSPTEPNPEAPRARTAAPLCAAFDANTRPPKFKLPSGATDCHAHICGPAARYEYFAERIYTPADALLTDYRQMLAMLGIERAVLVQPSVYGTDNSAMLDAMKAGGAKLRGVAVVADDIDAGELKRMHE